MEAAIDQEWLSADDVAAMFGVSKWTIYDMTHRSAIPHGRFGRRLVFNKADLEAWVRCDQGTGTAPVITPAVSERKWKKGSRKDRFG